MTSSGKGTPSRKLVTATVAVVATLGFFLLRGRTLPPETAARRFLDCVESSDAGCLVDMMGSDELAHGPTALQMQRFLETIFEPRLGKLAGSPATQIESGTDPEVFVAATRTYRTGLGREVSVGAVAYTTEGKTAVWPAFAPLLLALFQTYETGIAGERINHVRLRALNDLQPKLEAIGIHGAFLNVTTDGGRFYTWREWRDLMTVQLLADRRPQ